MGDARVLMMFGYPRSGSTVLGLLLQERLAVSYCGEVKHFWKRYDTQRDCTCGQPLDQCPVWSVVAERVLHAEGAPFGSSADAAAVQNDDRVRHAPENHDAYAAHLNELYREAAHAFGDTVLVDSSKGVDDARLVRELPGVDAWLLHLVRDPRGSVYSRARFRRQQKASGEASSLVVRWEDYGLLRDGAAWSRTDHRAAAFLEEVPAERRMTLRYEDFVARPGGDRGPDLRVARGAGRTARGPGQGDPRRRGQHAGPQVGVAADRRARWRSERTGAGRPSCGRTSAGCSRPSPHPAGDVTATADHIPACLSRHAQTSDFLQTGSDCPARR